jgi:hypothetical protein
VSPHTSLLQGPPHIREWTSKRYRLACWQAVCVCGWLGPIRQQSSVERALQDAMLLHLFPPPPPPRPVLCRGCGHPHDEMSSNGICVAEVIRSTDGDDTGGICWCSEP